MNFQDIIREVYDGGNKALKTTASLSASTIYVGNPTLYAVVNTGSASDPGIYIGLVTSTIGNNPVLGSGVANIGFATVNISNPTLYAVVNTAAAGITNSIVTVANTPLSTSVVGNLTLSDSKGFIGLTTVVQASSARTITGTVDVTSNSGTTVYQGGTWTVTQGSAARTITGNVTLSDSKTYVGLTTSTLGLGTQFIGLTTVVQSNSARTITGNLTLSDSKGFIGLVTAVTNASLSGNVTLNGGPNQIGSVTVSNPVTSVGLNAGVNGIGFATVNVAGNTAWSNPNTYIGLTTSTIANTVSVDATGSGDVPITLAGETVGLSAGVNSIGFVTVAQSNTTRSILGNLTLSDSKGFIGLVTAVTNASLSGNVTLNVSPNFIGLVTVVQSSASRSITGTVDITSNSGATVYQGGTWTVTQASTARTITGNLTLSDPKGFIGLVTIVGSLSAASGNVTLDPGSKTGLVGNVTLSDAKTYIGLTTSTIGNNPVLGSGVNNIGFATVFMGTPTIFAVVNTSAPGTTDITSNSGVTVYQGGAWTVTQASSTRSIVGNLTLSDPKGFIGLVTVVGSLSPAAGNVTLDAGSRTGIVGNVTLSDAKTFIGLVTAVLSTTARSITGNLTVLNAGTTKTLIPLPIAIAGTSVVTIAVPSNTFKMTHLLMNANATVGVSIKSGPTYLTGNASIRVTLSPTGGWVENGSPDSPVYIGLAGAAAIVVEKNDATTAVAGKVMYFDE